MRIGIPGSWLIQVSRMPVDNCQRERTLRFDFVCDRRWESLETTSNPEVRHCNSCDMNVHHCKTIEAARQCAHQGQCVALDPSIRRKAGDLSPSQLHTVEVMTLGFVSPD